MSELDTPEDPPTDPDEPGVEGADEPDSLGRPAPFRDRLRRRYGTSIDPHISLAPTTGPDAERTPAAAEDEDEALPSEKRLERLGKLMPAEYRYKFQSEIGRGGMGAVLEVRDRDLDRRLAMKVIAGRGTNPSDGTPTDRGKIARFLEEAQITGQLSHPGIVPVHEIGMDARGRLYFTMRLVQGKDLKQVFAAIHGKDEAKDDPDLADWTLARALSAVLRVCETMAFAHSNGVIHRDLKPSNIMVGGFGETYVMDWGLAKVMDREVTRDLRVRTGEHASGSFVHTDRAAEAQVDPDSPLLTMDGTVVGTPAYMAPEQARGEMEKVGPQSDVYSVGAILYHLLTGRAPYDTGEAVPPVAVLHRVMAGPPARVHTRAKDAPAELCAICEKAMSYSRKGRYATMLELAGDLQAYLEGRVVAAHETGSVAEIKKWVERNKAFAAVIAIAVLSLMVTIGRIGWIQNENNEVLADKNAELIEQGLTAQKNARTAQKNAEAAMEAQVAAEASERDSRRSGYLSNVLAAMSSLRLDETENARRHLTQADDPEFTGWEFEHLALATDTSLATWPTGFVRDQRVAWSPDGLWIASLPDSGSSAIELRRAPGGEVVLVLEGHRNTPTSLAFSPDGRWLASTSRQDTSVRLWDVVSGAGTVIEDSATLHDLAFAGEGTRLVGAGRDAHLWVWDLDLTGTEPEAVLTHHRKGEGGAMKAVATEGPWIATGSEDGLVRLWDLEELDEADPEEELQLPRAMGSGEGLPDVTALAFTDGGRLLAISNDDGQVRVVDTQRMATPGRTGPGMPSPTIASRDLLSTHATDGLFLPDGRLVLACTDGVLRVMNLAAGSVESVHGHGGSVTSLALGADGSRLLTGAADNTLRLWSCYALLPTTLFTGHSDNVRDLAFSPDGKALATSSDDGTARLWEAASGEVTHILRHGDTYVRCLVFSPDGEFVATGSGDKTVRLWDAETGDLFTIWEGHDKWIADLAFSPDSRYLATTSGDGTCRVWDVEEERCLTVFEQHSGWVHCLAWNASGTRLLSGGMEGEVLEWDPFTGEVHASLSLGEESITRLTWGPDPHHMTVSSLDGRLRVIDAGGQVAAELSAHDDGISSLSLAPDGARLVSGDSRGTLRLWDTSDWQNTIDLHTDRAGLGEFYVRKISACGFSPDGSRIASARGKLVRIWETRSTAERHEAMLAARRMVDLVDDLFNDFGLPSLVFESLSENRDIPGKLREAAKRRVTAAAQDPELLVKQARALLLDDAATADDHKNARVLAEMALDLDPTEGDYRWAVALACLRTADYVQAEAMLLGLEADGWHTEGQPHPELFVLLAMAEFHLGRVQDARERLTAMEDDMERPLWRRRAQDLWDEARQLVGA